MMILSNIQYLYYQYASFLSSHTFCIFQIYQRLGSLPEEFQSVFLDVINSRRQDIHQQLITDTNLISKATLKDFDWQIKVRTCTKWAVMSELKE